MLARTSSSLPASTKMTRSGWRPACASAGMKRSGLVRHQTILPFVLAATPAAKRAAAAPSTVPDPPPANSCSAPYARPPPGSTASISGTPNGRQPAFFATPPSIEEMRSRSSAMASSRAADIGHESSGSRGGQVRHHAVKTRLFSFCSVSMTASRCLGNRNLTAWIRDSKI